MATFVQDGRQSFDQACTFRFTHDEQLCILLSHSLSPIVTSSTFTAVFDTIPFQTHKTKQECFCKFGIDKRTLRNLVCLIHSSQALFAQSFTLCDRSCFSMPLYSPTISTFHRGFVPHLIFIFCFFYSDIVSDNIS